MHPPSLLAHRGAAVHFSNADTRNATSARLRCLERPVRKGCDIDEEYALPPLGGNEEVRLKWRQRNSFAGGSIPSEPEPTSSQLIERVSSLNPDCENVARTLAVPVRYNRMSRSSQASDHVARDKIIACGACHKISIRIGSKLAKLREPAGILFSVSRVGNDGVQVASI